MHTTMRRYGIPSIPIQDSTPPPFVSSTPTIPINHSSALSHDRSTVTADRYSAQVESSDQ